MKQIYNKPNIILASFPRSGNTFLRNILIDVFGVYSWNNIDVYNKAQKSLAKYEKLNTLRAIPPQRKNKMAELEHQLSFPIIKTHEIPSKILPLCETNAKIIYLVRDGRDALLSMAHHRKDIVEPGTDLIKNLKKALRAPLGSYFAGWGNNVQQWTEIADLVIYFEQLISNPEHEIERMQKVLDLPEPALNNIPTFDSQRAGGSHFGGKKRENLSIEKQHEFNAMFFRSGTTGGWKEEMPVAIQKKFWKKYGAVMVKMGYQADGSLNAK